jgi:hypothetical protein
MSALLLLFIVSIIGFVIFIKLFKKLGYFWTFIIFCIIYIVILNSGIEDNDLNLEYN